MIESRFWREKLREDIAWLRANQSYSQWSNRKMVLYERRLILVGCQIRILLDHHKVARPLLDAQLACVGYRKSGPNPTTLLSRIEFENLFDDEPLIATLSARDLSNQLIHHYVIFAVSKELGTFTCLLLFSDFLRNERLYEIEIGKMLEFFSRFADESAARQDFEMTWNPNREDYDVE